MLLLHHHYVDVCGWMVSITYAQHLVNRLSSSAIDGKTPLEVWSGKPTTDYDSLHVFGYIAYYHVIESLQEKLELHTAKIRMY